MTKARPVAVILGAAVRPDGSPSPTLQRRCLHAVSLYQKAAVTHVICSGGLGRFGPSEASVMRQICQVHGVPDRAILIEEASRSTLENMQNIRPILADLGAPPVLIVTDFYHRWRAALTARHFAIPARMSCPKMSGTKPHRILKAWLREIPALLYYCWKLRPRFGPEGGPGAG
jgi:uncharacterized SAM-binding protein YcdF (DUF218 family)